MARVLLIDDDKPVRTTLAQILKHLGHEVVEAEDGRQGLTEFRHATFDLVITDIVMPDVEGIEVLMELRRERSTVKVLAISGGGRQSPQDYLHLAKMMGATKVLAKPFGMAEFSAAVGELLAESPPKAGQ